MKNKRAFTLMEVLSVVALMGVIVVLVVPQINESLSSKKEREYEKVSKVIETAASIYHLSNKDKFILNISDMMQEKYLDANLKNPITGEKITGCVRAYLQKDNTYNYKYDTECNVKYVPLIVQLNGGETNQKFESSYLDGTIIPLEIPTRHGFDFINFEVVRGDSFIADNKLIIGKEETELYAMWINWPRFTVDLNGGNTNQLFEESYKSNTIIELEKPTRNGYVFVGWSITEGNGLISGDKYIVGNQDVTLTANWQVKTPVYAYLCGEEVNDEKDYYMHYTGECKVYDDGDDNWRIKFLTSGTLTLFGDSMVDVFLVGGGGAGSTYNYYYASGGGGGGGYTLTEKGITLSKTKQYEIIIGDGGSPGVSAKATEAFGFTANPGKNASSCTGGAGGSGGASGGPFGGSTGGSNGSNGNGGGTYYASCSGASGSGKTTCEFGEQVEGSSNCLCNSSNWTDCLYSGGGGGGGYYHPTTGAYDEGHAGGSGGGGYGVRATTKSTMHGTANTGGGGGGANSVSGGKGGSGVVVMRNARGNIKITYDNAGGTGCSTKYVFEGDTYGFLCTPEKEGYHFLGWYLEDDHQTKVTEKSIITNSTDFTLYGLWAEKIPYTCANSSYGDTKDFVYTGNCEIIYETPDDWKIKFLTSGNLTYNVDITVDAFLVGGGGAGSTYGYYYASGGGGGGGYTLTEKAVTLSKGTTYKIVVGDGGTPGVAAKATEAFGFIAEAGKNASSCTGGAGGSGGASGGPFGGSTGGSNGATGNGGGTYYAECAGGAGSGKNTCEFGEQVEGSSNCLCSSESWTDCLYSAGGGGGGYYHPTTGNYDEGHAGGIRGGGAGVRATTKASMHALVNTGSGGGGANSVTAGNGGSGIAIIRNAR